MSAPSPHEAERAVASVDGLSLDDARDRRVHARVAVGFGVALGCLGAVAWAAADARWGGLIAWGVQIVFLVAVVVLSRYRERASRTVPRRARRYAVGGVLVCALPFLVLTTMVFLGGPPASNPALAALAGLVIAAPAVLAGVAIRRGGDR